MFDHIINWELKAGSHEFPGPEGGTCINEAAIVAAGFEYRRVNFAEDCPPCFSRVFAAYALRLNDSMPNAVRQRLLMPFVTRLAGTADVPEVERQRAEFMAIQTVRRILPPGLRARGFGAQAKACEAAKTLIEARRAADGGVGAAYAAAASAAAAAAAAAASARAAAYYAADAYAADAAVRAAYAAAASAASAVGAAVAIWEISATILDEAMQIGRQPTPIEVDLVIERMDAIKSTVKATVAA